MRGRSNAEPVVSSASAACPVVVAIPVRDEEDRIAPCLYGLAAQTGRTVDHVVLLLNNCTDRTAARVDDLAPVLPFGLTVAHRIFSPAVAHVGTARREAMEIAGRIAGPDGILLTTDADGVVAPDWISQTFAAFDTGVDVVCGRAEIDPEEARAIPAYLHRQEAEEIAYGTLLDRLYHLLDPDPHDPWPRHTEHSGASIAVTVRAWRRAGGIPPQPLGEDRGFMAALRRIDAPIRHAPGVTVTVSGRLAGRARGGMADTMARHVIRQDTQLDDALEPTADCLRRAMARAALRRLRDLSVCGRDRADTARQLADMLRIPADALARPLAGHTFGAAWESLERCSPSLHRRRVLRRDLAEQHAMAQAMIDDLVMEMGHGRSVA
ncbi:putative glycosyl transferase protein [Gluconacetobacter diazotrophicus PA1 5]|uniref:Putative glycosyl transferase protein n=1 Tax=Gluconacetobacter diazotrophicus (strain ATCC 49037 / DSM 5601 / CCUG 37298 / CIP 103539 / LMG 7603 / PAl5) TaxID=272568 RepID=A9HNV2_GLUDA|nr:putative glycosyl transferase protein [Gluconacetobacter diazotrophicus PA1 5]